MSVINETLDNLKQTKKRETAVLLDPASSDFVERRDKNNFKSKTDTSLIIPLSIAVLIGVFFIAYRINTPSPSLQPKTKTQDVNNATVHWQNARKPMPHQAIKHLDETAQAQYYTAMELLNEGQDTQALLHLKEIVKQYPNFTPAKNAYSMLNER